jgi:phthalate 4,5-dioxygenase reductase subunit
MTISLVVSEKSEIVPGIFRFELRASDGAALPEWEAGAHLRLMTPSGAVRRYSLCNDPAETGRYVLGVKREANGDGGSISMTDRLVTGDRIESSTPVNDFPLDPDATSYLLIAGGIGITPMLAMACQLQAGQKSFRLIYCARSAELAAFHDQLTQTAFAHRVTFHFDGGERSRALDVSALLSEHPPGCHVYCCGPRPLMLAVRAASSHWPKGTAHFEDFGTSEIPEPAGSFRVRLARSNAVVVVPPGISILEALRRRGLDVPSSCEAGTCGSCRVGLLAGVADHRDFVLDEDEFDSAIMICVSRALSEELTIDV